MVCVLSFVGMSGKTIAHFLADVHFATASRLLFCIVLFKRQRLLPALHCLCVVIKIKSILQRYQCVRMTSDINDISRSTRQDSNAVQLRTITRKIPQRSDESQTRLQKSGGYCVAFKITESRIDTSFSFILGLIM